MSVYSSPALTGQMIVSSNYHILGSGTTDRVFIVGHADGLALNDPYPVLDVKAAVTAMNSDSSSPLIRTMLEVYYGGGRDIWVVAAAPMNEYQPNISLRDYNYYNTYFKRLTTTYSVLRNLDLVQILVVAEAPFYAGDALFSPTSSYTNSWEVVAGGTATSTEVDGMPALQITYGAT